ncbi:uncharacterized protein LOC136081661 isoform X3 [Hydra vulgaris]|uniref:Uncharacterized protein LOC136081661 isoform X3 n=1 Tax=Hydra vulgaris TaxID=6087 RepID=A0ABM4C1E3_HYDVU
MKKKRNCFTLPLMMFKPSQTFPQQIYSSYPQVINQNNIQGTVQHMYQNSQPQQIHSFQVPSTHMTQYASAQPFTPNPVYIQNTDPSPVYSYNRQYNINATPYSFSSYTPIYPSHSYPHQTQSPQYLVQGYQNGVILQTQQHPSQNQRCYTQPTPSQQIQQHIVPIQPAQIQHQPEYQPKKTAIKLTDPKTGDDIPINFPKKEQEKVHIHMGNPYTPNISLPIQEKIDDIRAQVNASFAAQVIDTDLINNKDNEVKDIHFYEHDAYDDFYDAYDEYSNDVYSRQVDIDLLKIEGIQNKDIRNEKRQYSREFLLQFQSASICSFKPLGLPDIDIVLNEPHEPTKAFVPGEALITNDFMPSYMSSIRRPIESDRSKGNGLNKRSGDKNNVSGIIDLPKVKHQNLKNVNSSEMLKTLTEKEKIRNEIERKMHGILIAPKMFMSVSEKVIIKILNEFKIDNKEKLEVVVDLIFEKAVSNLIFSFEYANLCHCIIDCLKKPVTDLTSNEEVMFSRVLLNKCQAELEILLDKSSIINDSETFGKLCFIRDLFKSKLFRHDKENLEHIEAMSYDNESMNIVDNQKEIRCTIDDSNTWRNVFVFPKYRKLNASENIYREFINHKEIRKMAKSIIYDYLNTKDTYEVVTCLKEEKNSFIYKIFVEEAIAIVIEMKSEERQSIGTLIHDLIKKKLLNDFLFCQGLTAVVEKASEYIVDIPYFFKYLGEVLGPIIYDYEFPQYKVNKTLQSLIESDKIGIVMSEALSYTVKDIEAEQFEVVKLCMSDNPWVRTSVLTNRLSDEEKEIFELARSIRGILNKLTPQKLISLLDKMKQLNIDTKEKLEIAIDLIFEKAVSEPVYSVAYANLCHRLIDCFKQPMTDTSTPNGTITFRRILLNKCQKEFNKDSSDEKLLEDKSRTFDTEAESKLRKADLDKREIMNRRRMLGNIRFIGELFKLKMISENIIHDCVIKLLKCEKVESAEDQLECLCKLLATISKDFDHPKAKLRVDQYFAQMSKIIDRKKISTRIKFAIKDIIDLRSCNWIPRKDDSNPKTIDQIHKEAKYEEKEMKKMRQQDKMRPKERGSQRKNISENISLGPGGFRSSWSRGASGGNSISSSGAPASVESVQNRQTNRYDVLSEQIAPSGFDSKRGSRGLNTSQTSGGKSSRVDCSAAIRAVQDITSIKNQFSKHSQNGCDSPRSSAQTPVEMMDAASDIDSTVIKISEEDMRKKTKSTINEYLSIRDTNEAITCLKEVNCSYLYYLFVEEAITIVIEIKSEERKSIGALLHDMIIKNVITVDQLCKGLASIVQNAPNYAVGIPHFYKYLGEVIGPMVYDGAVPLNRVKDTLEPLVKPNKAGDVMAEALSVAVQIAGKEESVSELWSKSNIKWEMLLNNDENVDKFIKDKSECSNCKSDPYFIKELTSMICNSTIKVEDTTNTCSCNNDELEKRKNILLKYIDGNKNLELFALYGVQHLVTTLHHPIGLANSLFQDLYNHDIISEETFFTWESSKEFPDGKGNTINSVKDFLSWLRKAEEESSEEDSTQKMEFLMNSTSSNKSHSNNVLKGLLRILHDKGDNNKITSYIDSECSNCKSDPYFIKELTSMICNSTIKVEDTTNTCSCNNDELEKRKNILLKYIDGNKNLELFALYGVQHLVTTLHHPIGLANSLFQDLYNHDIISEETFFTWESSKEFPDGKGNTINSVKDFLSWLRKAEEESSEEDSTQKMEFLMNSTSSNKSHSNNVLKGLLRILHDKGDNNKITSYIDSECSNCKSDPYFIKELTSMICNSTIKVEDTTNTCSCNNDELEKRKNILLKYIDGNKNLELFALYGVQHLVTTLHHPIGLANSLFQDLYNHDIISEETFFTWESSKEFPDGKGNTINSVKDFLSWLRKAEEESSEEDSTQKMEFLMNSTSSNKSHSNNVLKGLLRILHDKGDNNKITSYIDSECSNCKSDPYFIKELTSMICNSTIKVEDTTNTCSCNNDELEKRKNILLKYIDGNKNLELFALYGVQHLVTTLHHPIGLANSLFQDLYNHDIISEETFFTWESSKEFPDGKGNTISSVKDFLSWLRKAEEESNEEDSTHVFN